VASSQGNLIDDLAFGGGWCPNFAAICLDSCSERLAAMRAQLVVSGSLSCLIMPFVWRACRVAGWAAEIGWLAAGRDIGTSANELDERRSNGSLADMLGFRTLCRHNSIPLNRQCWWRTIA